MSDSVYRKVPGLDPVIEEDAYNYLLENNEELVKAIEEAVSDGFTAEELFQHWLRKAGGHRFELAKRIKNAALHVIRVRKQTK